jgi:hypothetical protein
MADILMVGAPTVVMAHRRLIEREQTSPPTGHCPYLSMFLLCAATSLGLLLHRVTDPYPLNGSGFLFWMQKLRWRWSSSYGSSPFYGRGDLNERESALGGREMMWWLPSVLSGGLTWSVTPNTTGSRLSNKTIGIG